MYKESLGPRRDKQYEDKKLESYKQQQQKSWKYDKYHITQTELKVQKQL